MESTVQVIPLATVRLQGGAHNQGTPEVCLLECVSLYDPARDAIVLNGIRKTDQHVSATLGAFGRSWNDALAANGFDDTLDRLKGYTPRLKAITAATPEDEDERGRLLLDWIYRVAAPEMLDAAAKYEPEMQAHADALRALPEVPSAGAARAARAAWAAEAAGAAEAARATGAARAARATGAAGAAGAAWAAWAAEAAGAAEAARATGAAGAARAAIYSGALIIAVAVHKDGGDRAAMDAALKPVIERLQESAFALFDRMLAVGAAR